MSPLALPRTWSWLLPLIALSATAAAQEAFGPALGGGAAEREPGFRPAAYAIRDARIITGTGAVIAKGTVVIRGGDIEAVGADAAVPFDAEVIDGTGLTVTPGLID